MGFANGWSDKPPTRLRHADDASFASAALPLLLGATGMAILAAGLVLAMPVLAMAGAGLVVVGFAIHLIVASLDRAEARAAQQRRDRQATRQTERALPRRGPLADAAVAALTRSGGGGGIFPPLSTSSTQAGERVAPAAREPARSPQAVAMWDAHGKVAPPAFQDGNAPSPGDDELVEFASVPAGETLLQAAPASAGAVDLTRGVHLASSQEDAEEEEHDHRLWPGTKDLGAWAHLTGERRTRADARSAEQRRSAMVERRARLAERLPTVGAILAEGDNAAKPPRGGATRGKCSRCSKFIWAPAERPITLKCPGCGHKARLY